MSGSTAGYVPSKVFLTSGVGVHRERLISFEQALRDARVARYNLSHVSSIFPPRCDLVDAEEALEHLETGEVVHSVIARAETDEASRLISASIGLALPEDRDRFGYLSEHHGYGQTAAESGEYAEDLAASMLATVLGVDFDPESDWDEQREQWRLAGTIYGTTNITEAVEGPRGDRWATVVAAAVFCA